jgi:hypothetical protein
MRQRHVAALQQAGFDVVGSDITQGVAFLGQAPETGVRAIITNPPYALAQEFIERALDFDDTRIVAMLLRTDFDHAASRAHLFADCAMFAKRIVLTKRIRLFEDSNGSPSFNHCWMIGTGSTAARSLHSPDDGLICATLTPIQI